MKLTPNHIQELYKFTRQHYVYHYDVQSELVDHLANDIEEIWKDNPKISFEDARDKSFKKFGIFGFMDVVEAKQKQMNKRYWKILWRFAKDWFTIPKVAITLLILISVFGLLQIPSADYIILGGLLIGVFAEVIMIYGVRKQQKEKEKKKEKIFLLEELIGSTKYGYTGFVFINLFNFVNLSRFDFSESGTYWQLLIAAIVTLLIILFYVANYILPEKAEELLQETYPEYKFVKNL